MNGPGKKKYTVADCTGANCKMPKKMRGPKPPKQSRYKKVTPPDDDKFKWEDPNPTEKTNLEVVKHGENYSQTLYSGIKTPEAKAKYSVKDTDVKTSVKPKDYKADVEETEETAPKKYSVKTMKKSDMVMSPRKTLKRR